MKRDVLTSVRWFDAEQALAWALQAYYAACRQMQPPVAIDDLDSWASEGDFLWAFHSAFTLRLNLAAFVRGSVPASGSASELLGWPDEADLAGKVDFVEHLKIAGLRLPENADHNATAGGSAHGQPDAK